MNVSNGRGAYLGYSAPSVICCIYEVSEVLSQDLEFTTGFELSSIERATLRDSALLLSFSIKEVAQEIKIRNGVSEEQFQLEEIAITLDDFE